MEWGWYRASCPSRKEVLDNRSGSSYYHGNKICHREKAPAPSDSAEPGLWPIHWPISENQRVDTVDKAVICTHRKWGQKCRKAPNSRAFTSRRIFKSIRIFCKWAGVHGSNSRASVLIERAVATSRKTVMLIMRGTALNPGNCRSIYAYDLRKFILGHPLLHSVVSHIIPN